MTIQVQENLPAAIALRDSVLKENFMTTVTKLTGRVSAHDIDDTSLEENPDFTPDLVHDGHSFVELCGEFVQLNEGFHPTGDTLVNLREAFGSTDPVTGELWGRIWDRICKETGEISFEEHLRLQFEDVLVRISVEQAIQFATKTLRPKVGFSEFLVELESMGVTPVFVTNGADLIAGPVMKHFFGDVMPEPIIYANMLVGDQLKGMHGSVGVAKNKVVDELGDVLFFFGDSGSGDGPGATAVHNRGGHVFTLTGKGKGSLYALAADKFNGSQWTHLDNYVGVPARIVQQVISAN